MDSNKITQAIREGTKEITEIIATGTSVPAETPADDKKAHLVNRPMHELGKEIVTVRFDMEKIRNWRSAEGFPPLSCFDIYSAIGLDPSFEKWVTNSKLSVISAMQIGAPTLICNQLESLLESNWQWWPVELAGDGKLVWRKGWSMNPYKYQHTLKAAVKNSIKLDIRHYGPFDDPNKFKIDDDTITFYEREATTEEKDLTSGGTELQ